MVNKRIDFTLGNRPKYTIEPNDVFEWEDAPAEETQALETIMSSQEVRQLRLDCNRVNKNCELHEKLTQLGINNMIFGRSLGGITRKKTKNFPYFGEPTSIRVLNTMRIKKVQ